MHSVLIIEDDLWMQRILAKTLQSFGFSDTYLASDGFEGMALALEKTPSLIILDILMPEMSGHIVLKLLKRIPQTREIPVIIVSALSDLENLGRVAKAGTAYFISKPFTKTTIEEKLIEVFGRENLNLIKEGKEIIIENPQEKMLFDSEINDDDTENKSSSEVTPTKVYKKTAERVYTNEDKKDIEALKKLLLKK